MLKITAVSKFEAQLVFNFINYWPLHTVTLLTNIFKIQLASKAESAFFLI